MLISKKILEYLAELGRLELTKGKEQKLLKDLEKILGHFDELKEVDTNNIEPLPGGTIERNIFRDDEPIINNSRGKEKRRITQSFPEEKDGFLKVPPVFE